LKRFCVFAFLRFCVFAFLRFCVFAFLRFFAKSLTKNRLKHLLLELIGLSFGMIGSKKNNGVAYMCGLVVRFRSMVAKIDA
jgi:hypothetical protein